jgi:hypothetical protein
MGNRNDQVALVSLLLGPFLSTGEMPWEISFRPYVCCDSSSAGFSIARLCRFIRQAGARV